MKRSSPLWGSVSVLIGVVIAILALVRGAWLVPLLLLTFTAWGLWVVMFQLQPAWDSIRGYRKKEHDARKQREASLYSTAQTSADAMQLLLRHVNHRISAYLKSVYPSARWEWTTGNPTALVIQGGTGRIRVYGIEEYDYADVQIDRNGNLSCNLLKVVPVQPRIRNDQIRHRFPCQFPCLDPVMGHTYNLHIQRSPIDQIADQLAYTKFIIHNQYLNHCASPLCSFNVSVLFNSFESL